MEQKQIPQYELLGYGASGLAYKATYQHKEVAIKQFFPGVSDGDIIKEVKNLMLFDHKNISSIITYNLQEKWIMLPLYKTTTLFDFIEQSTALGVSLNSGIKRAIVAQIIEGLEELHSKNYAHRDIKLENIFIGRDNQIKIGDLGYMTQIEEGTFAYRKLGTSTYRAQELYWESPKIETIELIPTDVYSLGVVIFGIEGQIAPYTDPDKYPNNLRFQLVRAGSWNIYWSTLRNQKFDDDFKELIENTLQPDPLQRWTLKQVKESNWMRKEQPQYQELNELLNQFI